MLKKWISKYWIYFIIIALCIIAITQYEDYLKSHNEALMVLITAVYLFATIRISYANIESAKATREQLSNSNENYEDSRHLQVLPFFKAGLLQNSSGCFQFFFPLCPSKNSTIAPSEIVLTNIGRGSALDLKYDWKYAGNVTSDSIGISFIKEDDKLKMQIYFTGELSPGNYEGILTIYFNDMLGWEYTQDILLRFEPNSTQASLSYVETGAIKRTGKIIH